jgi:hypothetical protein
VPSASNAERPTNGRGTSSAFSRDEHPKHRIIYHALVAAMIAA